MSKLIISVLVMSLTACASMPDYRTANVNLNFKTNAKISVGVQDHRPYVLNHEQEESFAVTVRPYGIPTHTFSASKRPIAIDLTDVLAKGLSGTGAVVTKMRIMPEENMGNILSSAMSQKVVLLTLDSFKTDTYQGSDMLYDMTLRVISPKGVELAKRHIEGREYLGKSINVLSVIEENAPKALQKKIEQLFDGDVAKALSE